MKHAFYDVTGLVRQVLVAELTPDQLDMFLADYAVLFEAVGVESVPDTNPVWLSWTRNDDGTFAPSPEPVMAEPPLVEE